jgi:hypothetical protein
VYIDLKYGLKYIILPYHSILLHCVICVNQHIQLFFQLYHNYQTKWVIKAKTVITNWLLKVQPWVVSWYHNIQNTFKLVLGLKYSYQKSTTLLTQPPSHITKSTTLLTRPPFPHYQMYILDFHVDMTMGVINIPLQCIQINLHQKNICQTSNK